LEKGSGAFWVYVLKSARTGRFYTGSCENFERRFHEHNTGQSPATRHGVPWELVYREKRSSKADAVQRERYFKTGAGRDELKRLVDAAAW